MNHPRRRFRMRRGGFALLAVLWVMAGMVALSLAISLAAREAVSATENRKNLMRAAWMAEGCTARALAVVAGELSEPAMNTSVPTSSWNELDRSIAESPLIAAHACEVSARVAGSRLDVNRAGSEILLRALRAMGLGGARTDSLVDALLDWRDADDVPRRSGAERDWYLSHGRHLPRNGPLASRRELLLIRGFAQDSGAYSLLDVEPGRVDLNRAAPAVLAGLPGFGPEAVARVGELRLRGVVLSDLTTLAGQLSPAARQSLLARYADLVRLTTTTPDAWIVTSRAHAGSAPAVTAGLELRLVRAGARAAVVRRRTWIE